jgi:DNA-binding CsgD family transcriptional regulator
LAVLVGRDAELERIEQLLTAARAGRTVALVVAGEPGVGKTALLEACADGAEDFRVLRTRGVEAEVELPFAALVELLAPLADRIESLPRAQASVLQRALALEPTTQNEAAAAAATLALLALAAEESPVLVLVDDAQWLDASSGLAVAFAARRLHEAPLAFVFAAREDDEPRFSLEGIDIALLLPLGELAATELVICSTPALDEAATARVVSAAAGNPLALLELPSLLSASPEGPALPEPLPAGAAARRLFGRRLDALDSEARSALLVAAAERSGDLAVLDRAWRSLGLEPDIVEAAERANLAWVKDNAFEFRHPLVRSLVHGEASPADRRRAHAALASALADDAQAADEWAWHRALAAIGPDAEVADALAASAEHQPPRAAAAALERAARLTPDRPLRARRLLAAADAANIAGEHEASARLAEAGEAETEDPVVHATAERLIALSELERDRPRDAVERLARAADAIEDLDPILAARLLADAIEPCAATGQLERGAELGGRARSLARDADASMRLQVELRYADAVHSTARFQEAEGLALQAAEDAVGNPDGTLGSLESRLLLAEAFFSGGDLDRARPIAEQTVDEARREGALGPLRIALATVFSIELVAGRALQLLAAAQEELELAEGLGRAWARAEALGHVAWGESLRGLDELCRKHVEERFELQRLHRADPIVHPSLGLLELALGRPEEAVEALEPTVRIQAERGLVDAAKPTPEQPLLIEAYARAGRRDEAERLLEEFERSARDKRPLARALAARCRGLLADRAAFADAFERALAEHDRGFRPFERARTLLLYGERLRRERRRLDARVRLNEALTGFEELGATSWSRRATDELAATGQRARRRKDADRTELTPQEIVVARLVAQGRTNREVATELFLTTNTIETHLRHIFQKLGVRSRTELAAKFTDFRDSTAAPAA